MKKLSIISLSISIALSALSYKAMAEDPAGSEKISKNFLKFNLTSAVIKNYSIQYERILSRGISLGVAYKIMPSSGLPYADKMIKWFDITDNDTQVLLGDINMENFTITPELRFYSGKKRYGRGFYFALFYRYGQYSVSNAIMPFETDLEDGTLNASFDMTSHTGGIMIGAQWALGKHLCLDWWILGPHFGVSSGDFTARSSVAFSEAERQDISEELNGIDIPMFDQSVNVTADRATMIFDGPSAGIRAGLSLGIKF